MAAPVTRDQELDLRIDSLAFGGNGVARLDGYVVFVRRGLPGDRVRARVTKVKRSHAEALAVEVLEPGPQRVEAPCPHFGACGGCRFQDLAYEAQLEAKQAQVEDALRRLGGIAEPPRRPDRPVHVDLRLPQQARVLVHADRGRPCARLPRRRALGPGAPDRGLPAHDRRRATRSATPSRPGRARRGSRPTTRRTRPATCATSSSARAATPARRSSSSSPPRASGSTATT